MRLFFCLLFLISANCDERPSHYPLITGNTFRALADFVYDETDTTLRPEEIQEGDIIFVSMPYLRLFFSRIYPSIRAHFILITSNGSGVIDAQYRPFLDEGKIEAWFGRNVVFAHPKLFPIPLGFIWFNGPLYESSRQAILDKIDCLTVEQYFAEKPILIYVNVNVMSHPRRKVVVDYFRMVPGCHIEPKKTFDKYLEDLSRSRFVISPRGINPDCFRIWETLAAGAIPVVESTGIEKVFEGLPVIVVEDLCCVTPAFLEEALAQLQKQSFNLDKLKADYWLEEILFKRNFSLSKK